MASMESTGSPPSRGRVSDQLSPSQESGGLNNEAPASTPYDESIMMPPVTRRDFASFTCTASPLDDYKGNKGKQSTAQAQAQSSYYDRDIITPVTRPDYSTTELLTSQVYRPRGIFEHSNKGFLPYVNVETSPQEKAPLSISETDASPSRSEASSGQSEHSSGNNSHVGHPTASPKQPFPEATGLPSVDHLERQAQLDDQLAGGRTASLEKPSGHRESTSTVSTCLTPESSDDIGVGRADRRQSKDTQVALLRQELDDAKKRIEHQALLIHQAEVIDRATSDSNSATSQPSPEPERVSQQGQTRQAFPKREDPPVTPSNWGDLSEPSASWSVQPNTPWGFAGSQTYNQYPVPNYGQVSMPFQPAQQRNLSVPLSPNRNAHNRGTGYYANFNTGGYGYYNNQNVSRSVFYPQQRGNAFNNFPDTPAVGGMSFGGLGPTSDYQDPGMYQGYTPQPIGTPLSPTANEFHSNQIEDTPWNSRSPMEPGETFVTPVEPLNYRRLLDRSVTMNWKYIVDKIVFNNDQQASIFLQQKLKVATVGQKYSIIEAIVAQAYPLMVNRFGNFLVQRCFEHGTPEQVVGIANAIRGNTLSLSMDAFGCHVVQKAFDAVPEDYKAAMVHELLRRVPDTVVHRYACHVWQKLFELRWADSPPQIMKTVNHSLRGMWHQVALGETGSLVVQNIFENCIEEDKRPCIIEVLDKIDIVAHGQFGNWCIQHICEHGDPPDKTYAIEHILEYATEYSIDQYASKVVEKCLKLGDPKFLDRYLARICQGRSERPRIPLIDIASDQYGNYLIQWILLYADPHPRDIVATHVRKHMVSLRGSKFGSRVGMLVCNPGHTPNTALFQPQPAGIMHNRFSSAPSNSKGHIGAPGASMHAFRNGPYR